MSAEDRLLVSIFGTGQLSVEEVLARPEDYVARKEEEIKQKAMAHKRILVGEGTDEEVEAKYEEKYPKGLKDEIDEVLGTLTSRERKVLRLRFGLDDGRRRTQAEVGQEIDRSAGRAAQIEKKALQKLRHPSRSRVLRDFLS